MVSEEVILAMAPASESELEPQAMKMTAKSDRSVSGIRFRK